MTGESTWKQPDALGITPPDGGRAYWIVDGTPSWTPPAEYAWRAVSSPDEAHAGRSYFENWRTKEATWERPAALGWSRRSYYNSASKQAAFCARYTDACMPLLPACSVLLERGDRRDEPHCARPRGWLRRAQRPQVLRRPLHAAAHLGRACAGRLEGGTRKRPTYGMMHACARADAFAACLAVEGA